jgi:hypothetical protein
MNSKKTVKKNEGVVYAKEYVGFYYVYYFKAYIKQMNLKLVERLLQMPSVVRVVKHESLPTWQSLDHLRVAA